MAPGYRLLEHPADLGLEARGVSLPEAFEQAARGLTSVLVELEGVEAIQERALELTAPDTESLLVRFLSEILFLYDAKGFLTARVEIGEFADTRLMAVARGEAIRPEKHRVRTDVKAITYHQLSIKQVGDEWIAVVYLDI